LPHRSTFRPNRFIASLDEFNTKSRQSQARLRRQFIEQRVQSAGAELRNVEEQLRTFYERNRSWQQSPKLVYEEGTLRRQVEIRQEVYLTLNREYETARIEEVNDTPVITVIDPAVEPRRPSKPKPLLISIVGFILGGIAAAAWAFTADYLEELRRENGTEYRSLMSLLQKARRTVTNLVRRRAAA
jgi:tyrosine-protein kinase Etk/Wzc